MDITKIESKNLEKQEIFKPHVPENYLQEHYQSNLQRKKSQKENYQYPKLFDNEKSPKLQRKNSFTEPLIQPKSNEANLLSKQLKQNETSSKSNTPNIYYTRVFPSFVKKKLKFSPPPEGFSKSDNSDFPSDWKNFYLVKMFRGSLKLKERLLVGVSVATVLFTLLLVVDLQMETGMTGTYFPPSHARVKMSGSEQFNSFRNRILKTNR